MLRVSALIRPSYVLLFVFFKGLFGFWQRFRVVAAFAFNSTTGPGVKTDYPLQYFVDLNLFKIEERFRA